MAGLHIGAVYVEYLQAVCLAEFRCFRNIGKDFVCGEERL